MLYNLALAHKGCNAKFTRWHVTRIFRNKKASEISISRCKSQNLQKLILRSEARNKLAANLNLFIGVSRPFAAKTYFRKRRFSGTILLKALYNKVIRTHETTQHCFSVLPSCSTIYHNGIRVEGNYSKKSKMRPISILLNAYQPERYKIETGSTRKV